LRKLVEVPIYYILHKLVGGSVPALRSELRKLLFRLGCEVHFHCLRVWEKRPWGNRSNGVILGTFPSPSANWVAFDGANIWVTNFSNGTVSKM
jgi:hypothetical protein